MEPLRFRRNQTELNANKTNFHLFQTAFKYLEIFHVALKATVIRNYFIANTFFGWSRQVKETVYFNSAAVLLNFSWIELQMFLRCCWLRISITMLLHLLYLCPFLDLGLFMPYLYDLFFIFTFIMINHIIS